MTAPELKPAPPYVGMPQYQALTAAVKKLAEPLRVRVNPPPHLAVFRGKPTATVKGTGGEDSAASLYLSLVTDEQREAIFAGLAAAGWDRVREDGRRPPQTWWAGPGYRQWQADLAARREREARAREAARDESRRIAAELDSIALRLGGTVIPTMFIEPQLVLSLDEARALLARLPDEAQP